MMVKSKEVKMAEGVISDEMIDVFAVQGTWEDIGSRIQDRYRDLLDRVTLYVPFVPGEQDTQWRNALTGVRVSASG